MNQDLQNLEIKVENDGATQQGRLTATEWNILVAAVKSLDLSGGSADAASILQVVANAGYATQEWVTSQKYITSSALDNLAKNLVTLDTTQAITGMKDFTNGLKIGGVSVYKSKEGIVFVDGNLVVRGGITAFGTNETITASIFEALPIDGVTLKRTENGVLYVASGGSGGSGGGGISIEDLDTYLTTNGYATQSWVTGRGYITGITGVMVTNALGYAPLNKIGDILTLKSNQYSGAYALDMQNSNIVNLNALFTSDVAEDPTEGIQFKRTNGNFDSLWAADGIMYFSPNGNNAEMTGKYATSYAVLHAGNYGSYPVRNPNALTWSGYSSGSYDGSTAQSIALPTKLSQLTDDVVSGKYLPITGGTVKGQVTSEGVENFVAKGATYSLYFGIGSGQVNRGIYDLTQNKWWIVRGADTTTTINASIIAEGLRINQSAFDNGLILNRTAANSGVGIVAMSNDVRLGTFGINGTKTFEISGDNGIVAQVSTVTGEATFSGLTTIKHGGNTPLVINQTYATNNSRGVVLMNGSMANGHMYYSHLFGKAASSKNSAYVGFYYASAGSDSNYLSMGLCGVNNVLNITAAGNVGIGTSSPSQKLHVAGNILATGGITATNSSDKRLKKNIRRFNASKVLMSLGGVYEYEYIDTEVAKNHIYEGTHYGLVYQHVKGTALDVICHEREDGMGALNYIHPKFISLIAGATMENISEVEKLKRKIRTLENKVKQLESRA